jgi:translation initiation factor 2B subunit (eIF-2B alpha/beta/delta family)
MGPELEKRIAALAADRESGASEILAAAIDILRDAMDARDDVTAAAQAICRAQPAMASVWNAAIAAIAAIDHPERFIQFAERVKRAPTAIARFTIQSLGADRVSLRIVTLSYSATVLRALETLATRYPPHVACSESRPALEGRKLASRLAAMDIPVTFFSDAAIGQALDAADAVLVGADAVAPTFFLNKSGTRMLATAAGLHGVPVYVVATRDKFISLEIATRLENREGPPAEVWESPPAGVSVRNPYFERIPLDLVSSVITDAGVIGAGSVPEFCSAHSVELPESLRNL